MKIFKIIVFIFIISSIFQNCTEEKFAIYTNLDSELGQDTLEIIEYLKKYNLFEKTKITYSKGFYVVLDSGDSETRKIKNKDIVTINYVGYSLDSNVFTTNIKEVADTAFDSYSLASIEPVVFTYTTSGWTLDFISLFNQFSPGNVKGKAFIEAVSDSFISLRKGGKLLVILPSTEAYENQSTRYFKAYSPVAFEIYITDIE